MDIDNWYPPENNPEEIASALHQRTEELYRIPGSLVDAEGFIECPVLVLSDIVIFPRMISPIFVTPEANLLAIQDAQHNNQTMIACVVQNAEITEPEPSDFLPVGVEIAVGRLLNLPDGNNSALVQGRTRVEVVEFTQFEPYFKVRARPIEEPIDVDQQMDALMRTTRDLFERCVQLDRSLPDEAYMFSLNIEEPGWLADMVATAISPTIEERQSLLLMSNPTERLTRINWLLAQELDVLQLEDEIQARVQNEVDRSQREFYLREQMKAIQTELGEGDIWSREIEEFRERIEEVHLPEEARAQAFKELERLKQIPPMAPEVGIIRSYLEWILDLPWGGRI